MIFLVTDKAFIFIFDKHRKVIFVIACFLIIVVIPDKGRIVTVFRIRIFRKDIPEKMNRL